MAFGQQQQLGVLMEPETVRPQIHSDPLAQANHNAIAAGLQFLSSQRRGRRWTCSSKGADVWTTAYILSRLGELPPGSFTCHLQQQIEDSLDWLRETQTSSGGWGFAPDVAADASSTAWTMIAFRQHGRPISDSAREFLRRCRLSDGAFTSQPHSSGPSEFSQSNLPAVTAIAVRALGIVTSSSSDLLEQSLRTAAWQHSQTFGLFVCSNILDWEPGATPSSLLDQIHRCLRHFTEKNTSEQALLLRCLVRLRMQRTWAIAADLCRAQQADGSWGGDSLILNGAPSPLIDDPIIITATALSALAMRDLQPGLYFGSDLPFRRLDEV